MKKLKASNMRRKLAAKYLHGVAGEIANEPQPPAPNPERKKKKASMVAAGMKLITAVR